MFSLCLSTGGGVPVVPNFATRCPSVPGGSQKNYFQNYFPNIILGGPQKNYFQNYFPNIILGGPQIFFSGVGSGATSGGGGGGPEFWSSELLDFLGGSRVLNFWISWRGPDVTPPRYHPPPQKKKI